MQRAVEIIRRRVKLPFDEERAKKWTALPRPAEDGLNAISFLFPLGEAFFCRSVAYYMDRITDPVLKQQAALFIHQEAMHSKEHARSNEVLKKANAFGGEMERFAKVSLFLARTLLTRPSQLAWTCAMEHVTSLLAATLLRRSWMRKEGTDPAFAALWEWHGAEEIEHKAVCFDVYQHLFGKGLIAWLRRLYVFSIITIGGGLFLALVFAGIRAKLAFRRLRAAVGGGASGSTSQASVARGPSFRVIFGVLPLREYFAFAHWNFHPWQQDDRPLLEAWKRANPGFGQPPSAQTP